MANDEGKTIEATEETAEAAEATGGKADEQAEEPKQESKTYTDADVDEIVKARLAREHAKWEAELEKQREEATEAEKLRGMNDLQRAEHEREKFRAENEALRRQLDMREQMDVSRDMLAQDGIHMPDELLRMFVSGDADTTKKAVDAIRKMWPKAIEAGVKEKLKGTLPKNPNPGDSKTPSAGAAFAKKYNEMVKGGK